MTQRTTTTSDAIYDAQFSPTATIGTVTGVSDYMKIQFERAFIIFQSTTDTSTAQLYTLSTDFAMLGNTYGPFDHTATPTDTTRTDAT